MERSLPDHHCPAFIQCSPPILLFMKKRFLLLFLAAIGQLHPLFAQKQGDIWHFGTKNVVSFASGAPVLGTTSNMETFEGCVSYCDANGQLLFYSNGGGRIPAQSGQNGGTIWDRNHNVMYDMAGTQGGGFSAAQSSVVVPSPSASNQYYLFTMEEIEFDVGGSVAGQPNGRGLSYFLVDMSLNGGLGGVAAYQGNILVPSFEGLCAVRHTNGTDYWILVHNSDLSGVLAFPVTVSGVGTPVLSNIPTGASNAIEASPNGKHVAIQSTNGITVVDFDAATGILSSPDISIVRQGPVEFSPNSNRLFQIDDNKIFFYSVAPDNMVASEALVGSVPPTLGAAALFYSSRLQLANDGNIYFCSKYGPSQQRMHAIKCPNLSASIVPNVVALPNNDLPFFCLPNFADHIFAKEIEPLPIDLGNTISICNGAIATITSNGNPTWIYKWSNGGQGSSISVNTPGTYYVTVTDGCRIGQDSVVVTNQIANVNAGQDQNICIGDVAVLMGTAPVGATIQWTALAGGNVTSPTLANTTATLNGSTAFVLEANIAGCTARDTVLVNVLPFSTATLDSTTIMVELGKTAPLHVNAAPGSTYQWSPATDLSCTDCPNPTFTANMVGQKVYEVLIDEPGKCPTSLAVEITVFEVPPPSCRLDVPNAFAPNGENRVFKPVTDSTTLQEMELMIYSRFGQLIYEGTTGWDGQSNGKDAPVDVYFYILNATVCEQRYRRTGEVTLLR
jgi:gliding motility-associated-like protein